MVQVVWTGATTSRNRAGMRLHALALSTFTILAACGGEAPAPAPDASTKPVAQSSASPSASPVASASADLPETAAAPSASPATSASAAPATPLIPSEPASAETPSAEDFGAQTAEIAVKSSSEQKCSTKVLQGWFELVCGEAEGLVRARKVDVEAGFDAKRAVLEADEGKTLRWVAPLPSDGALSRARFYGKDLHEIFLALENTTKGWKVSSAASGPDASFDWRPTRGRPSVACPAALPHHCAFFLMTNCTRRFFWRPASLVLGAIGTAEP